MNVVIDIKGEPTRNLSIPIFIIKTITDSKVINIDDILYDIINDKIINDVLYLTVKEQKQ